MRIKTYCTISKLYDDIKQKELSDYDLLPQQCARELKKALRALITKLGKYEEIMMGNKTTRMCRYLDRRLALTPTEKRDAKRSIQNVLNRRFPDALGTPSDDETDALYYNEDSNQGPLDFATIVDNANEAAGIEPVTSECEINCFLREHVSSKTDVMTWWKLSHTKYPNVAKLAKDYLSVMPSSVPAESVFSHAKFELDGKEKMKDDLFQAKMELSAWSTFLNSNAIQNTGVTTSPTDVISIC